MFSKKLLMSVALLSCCSTVLAEQVLPFSKQEIYARLSKGSDMLDFEQEKKYQEVIEQGEAIYLYLMEIMSETDESQIIGDCLGIIQASTGDKRDVVKFVKGMVPKYQGESSYNSARILMQISGTLGNIGDCTAIKALFPLLEHTNERVRYSAFVAISAKGDMDALHLLEQQFLEMPEGYVKRHLGENIAPMKERLGFNASPSSADFMAKVTLAVGATPEPEARKGEEVRHPLLSDDDVVGIVVKVFPFEIDEGLLANKAIIQREDRVIRVFISELSIQRLPRPVEMEVVIDAVTASVLDADLFQESTNTVLDAEWNVRLSDAEALSIARSAIGNTKYNKTLKVRIEHLEGGTIRVVFPFSVWRSDTGHFYPGPDFAAEVLVDANSGEVLRVSG